ncbi:uncharacterized protein LOC142527538 isoform X1 [Primulina tabacum]|uniref:uncharacterized protein LOC142527538 isoform X1 n=1 Tax=Primulina tabacum TaxID=48773 RepID=UPI003F5A1619
MGCAGSKQTKGLYKFKNCIDTINNFTTGRVRNIRKPKPWKHPQKLTKNQLIQLQEEFWHTAPHNGGTKEIWDALREAAEADPTVAQAILDNAGIIAHNPDMTVCFDGEGTRYKLPKYVLSDPTNLIRDG